MSITRKQLEFQLTQFEQMLARSRSELEEMPIGTLIRKKGKFKDSYFHSFEVDGRRYQRGLNTENADNRNLNAMLKRKRYLIVTSKCLCNSINGLKACLKTYQNIDKYEIQGSLSATYRSSDYLFDPEELLQSADSHGGFRRPLPQLRYDITEETAARWKMEGFSPCPFHPEGKRFKASCGAMVRSKSEVLMLSILDKHKIVYCYERPILLSENAAAYPDITILMPDGSLRFWEHLGKMDDSEYRARNAKKIKTYIDAGMTPGIDLLLTSETREIPADWAYLEQTLLCFLERR